MRPFPRSRPRLAALAAVGMALALLAGGCSNQPPTWNLVWQDEFDGPAGTLPDPAYWDYDVGGGGWGNGELQFYTARPENVALDGNGVLVITARREAYQGRNYTSARLNTRAKFEQGLGRWEARIRVPSGMGIWPAFWLLGASYPQVGWPACGEIDVMELRGQAPGAINGTLHATGASGGNALTAQYTCQVAPSCATPPCTPLCPFDEDFHVYAVEVEANRIRFEVDGAVYQEVKQDLQPPGSSWPFAAPFFAILNVAVGGSYVGAPDATTVFPQSMLVDYVRYYRLEP
jgi:beta-glucanase (GH16 family)